MATYKKPFKVFGATTLMGYSAQAMDTADGKRLGSYAIEAFEGKKTIKAEDNDVKVLVPFHAIQTAMYATMTEDAEKADAYCGDTEPIGEVWFTGTIDESEACEDDYRLIMPNNIEITDIADPEALKASPTDYSIKMNGLDLPIFNESHGDTPEAYTYSWSEAQADTPPTLLYQNPMWAMAVPCEWTGEVSVTVAHK